VNKRERKRAGCHVISPAPLSASGPSPPPANPVFQPDLCIHACEDSATVTELILACTRAHTHARFHANIRSCCIFHKHTHFGVQIHLHCTLSVLPLSSSISLPSKLSSSLSFLPLLSSSLSFSLSLSPPQGGHRSQPTLFSSLKSARRTYSTASKKLFRVAGTFTT
jgi:hypothetical protein